MSRLPDRDDTYVTTVRGMCRSCRRIVPARVALRGGQVWQQSLCPEHPNRPALIAADQDWYLREALAAYPDASPLPHSHPSRQGCPHDCGPCAWHATPCQLPVLSITTACNLACPICFTHNQPQDAWYMGADELRETVAAIVATTGGVDLINLTGGEPTLHPRLLELLAICRRPGIGRVTLNSNGITLAADPDLCRRLADLDMAVMLSCNGFTPEIGAAMHGRDLSDVKRRALDNLAAAGVRVTIMFVLARGVNEDALGGMLDLLRERDHILSLTVQTMTHTGQGGGSWEKPAHIPVDEATAMVCQRSRGELTPADFVGRPRAHPLCYRIAYLLKVGSRLTPFARFAATERIAAAMRDSYLLDLSADDDFFREGIDQAFARADAPTLAVLRRLVGEIYPPGEVTTPAQRQHRAEGAVRLVCVHTHMDEDNFDCGRALLCPDQVPIGPQRFVPACTYNLFYRQQDPRFPMPPAPGEPR